MAVPKFYKFFAPTLRALDEKSPSSLKELKPRIADIMELTKEDKAEILPNSSQPRYLNRIDWSVQYLKRAGLIEWVSYGTYSITDEGRKVLNKDANQLDVNYLNNYDSFKDFQGDKKSGSETPPNPHENDTTPRETIEDANEKIRTELSESLLQIIMRCTPDFFEKLVVDLLLAMGYGYDAEKSGSVIGRSGDEGIDGMISEDKLGFSHVYVQAKRWEPKHPVGRPEVQSFAGALLGKGATKGLFITTSYFTEQAKAYVAEQKAVHIVLVDGMELATLMMDFNIGVSTQRTFAIKQIDMDYFEEQ